MAAVTLRSGVASTSNNAAVVSASFTPTAGELLVVFTMHSGLTTNPTMSVSANSITFTAITNALKATSADILTAWVANQLVPGSPSAMTVTSTPGSASGGIIFVYSITLITRTGLQAIRSNPALANQASGSPLMNYGVTVNGNPLLACIFNATNPATMTPATGWTETATIGDIGYATPTSGGATSFLAGGTTNAGTISGWSTSSASAFSAIGLEVDASAVPSPRPDPIRQPAGAGTSRGAAVHVAAIRRARA